MSQCYQPCTASSAQHASSTGSWNSVAAARSKPGGFVLEIFSGSGHLSSACKKKGLGVIGALDVKRGAHFDLTRAEVQDAVIRLLRSGAVSYVHFGTPCTVFSLARKGLRNLEKAKRKEAIGCELVFFTARAIEICNMYNILWSVENPQSSMLWELIPIAHLRHAKDSFSVEFPMCAYGTPYKKMTRILTNCVELCAQ